MSSIIISGDTSGAITISAPAVAGTNTLTLPAATGTVLTTASTFGGTGPAFSAYKSSAQTLSAATFTKLTFDTEEYDTNNNFASSRFTPTVAGYYLVTGNISNGSNTQTVSSIYKNGSEYKVGTNGSAYVAVSTGIVYCNGSTDYIELYGYFAAGGATGSGVAAPSFQAAMIRSA